MRSDKKGEDTGTSVFVGALLVTTKTCGTDVLVTSIVNTRRLCMIVWGIRLSD